MRRAIVVLLLVPFAAGCGTYGPLYLRDHPPSGVKPLKPEPYTPLPYPKEDGEDEAAGAAKK